VGDQGTVLISNDGGGSWTVELLPIEFAARWIRSVWLTRGGVGLAVGAEGLVFGIEGNALRLLGGDAGESHS